MTTSFPTTNWDGTSDSRPNPSGQQRGPDGEDWQRLTAEVQAVQRLLDGLGVSTVGAFAAADPDTGNRLFADTLVLTLGGTTNPETFANIWDGTSESRDDASVVRAPDADDWRALIIEINALEARVQPLGIPDGGVLPTSEPATGGYLWADGTNEVQSLAQIASTSGTWTLGVTLPGNSEETTAALDFNASAAAIQTAVDAALAGLSANGVAYTAGDIAITGGPINAGAVTITYSGDSVKNTNTTQVTTADVDLNDATQPVASTTTPGVPGVVTVSDEAGSHTADLWDGTSNSRPDADVYRAPDWQDYRAALLRLYDMSQKLVPLGFTTIGVAPTSDPTTRTELWTNTNIVTVSNG